MQKNIYSLKLIKQLFLNNILNAVLQSISGQDASSFNYGNRMRWYGLVKILKIACDLFVLHRHDHNP